MTALTRHPRIAGIAALGLVLAFLSLLAVGAPSSMFAGDGDGGGGTPTPQSATPKVAAPAGWSTTGSLTVARSAMAVAVTKDGSIYAIGGQNSAGSTLPVVDVYNPSTGLWSAGKALNGPRRMAAATVGADGLVYVIGGDDGRIQLDSLEVYDPAQPQNGWMPLDQHLASARRSLAAVTGPGGEIYAIGGYSVELGHLDSIEVRDAVSGGWSILGATLPQPLSRLGSAVDAQGRIYVIGGQADACDLPDGSCAVSQVSRYDPISGWTVLADAALGSAREQLGGAVKSDGVVYAIAGVSPICDDSGCPCPPYCAPSFISSYVPGQSGWTTITTIPARLSYTGTALGPDGRIYIIGGTDGTSAFSSVQVFDSSQVP